MVSFRLRKMLEPTQGKFEVSKFDGEGDFTLWKHRMHGQLEILGFGKMLSLRSM